MTDNDRFRFVSLLALELENGDITLPSLPDVVLKIRALLERDNCDFEQISNAVSIDPILVTRLLVFANSAYYNRANVKIETLDAAIGRLGFEVVRNTAVSLAIKQLYLAEKHRHLSKYLRTIWARGMKLSSMSFAIARRNPGLNEETAFMCGLLHDVGKLYILTKSQDFPEFLGDSKGLEEALESWNAQIGKSIIESWGFPEEVAESADPGTYLDEHTHLDPAMVDVVLVATVLVDSAAEDALPFDEIPSCVKLGLNEENIAGVLDSYRDKLKSVQQSLS